MATRWARVVRGLVTAVLSVFIAAFSHIAGGGSVPGQLGVALALIAATLVCIALAGKSLSRTRLGISVALSQFAFHLLFGLGAGPMAMTSSHSNSAHDHGSLVMTIGPVADSSSTVMAANSWMWFAHAAAAIITIVVLRRGESAFWGLVELGRTTIAAVFFPRLANLASTPVDAVRVRVAVEDRSGLHDLGVILSGRPHRGPPRPLVLSF